MLRSPSPTAPKPSAATPPVTPPPLNKPLPTARTCSSSAPPPSLNTMPRPRKLSQTKAFRRQIRSLEAQLEQSVQTRALERQQSEHHVRQLKQRLQNLIGADFWLQEPDRFYTASVRIETYALRNGGEAVLRDAIVQLFDKIYKTEVQAYLPAIQPLLETVKGMASNEFRHRLIPYIDNILRSLPANEPPIYPERLYALANEFLAAFTEMAQNANQEPSWPGPGRHLPPPRMERW